MNASNKLIALIAAANLANTQSDYPNVYKFWPIDGDVTVSYWDVYTQSRAIESIGYDEAQMASNEEKIAYEALEAAVNS